VKDLEPYKSNNDIIALFGVLDLVLLAIMVIDVVAKVINHNLVVREHFPTKENESQQDLYFDEPLTFDPFKNDGGLFLIKTDYIIMDAILVVAILAMYIIQVSLGDELNYLHIGILMMGRGFFKIPISVALIQFIFKVKQMRQQQLLVHPIKNEQ
jgi:hypothetical protein